MYLRYVCIPQSSDSITVEFSVAGKEQTNAIMLSPPQEKSINIIPSTVWFSILTITEICTNLNLRVMNDDGKESQQAEKQEKSA